MVYTLSHLALTCPGVRRPGLLAVIALLIHNNKLNAKSLLQHCIVLHLLLDCHLKFDSTRMRLSPNKFDIQKLYPFKSLHVF
jgi:hypothetical protein